MSTALRLQRRPRRQLAGVVVASALLLSGCGASGWSPGVGIRAGDETISSARVERLTASYCEAIEQQLEEGGQTLPGRYLRGGVAAQLALAAAAEQMVEEHGVDVAGEYDQRISTLEQAVAELPEDQQEAVLEIEGAGTYILEAKVQVGQALLAEEGVGGEPDREAALARGEEAFAAWLGDHEVRLDPSYGMSLEDGQPVPVDTSLSFAVSETATQGGAESPDPAYAGALPDSQRCG